MYWKLCEMKGRKGRNSIRQATVVEKKPRMKIND